MRTLYATFADSKLAEKAVGALLDHGTRQEDVTLVASDPNRENDSFDTATVDKSAKIGITTTTAEDAESGAAKGAGIGLGLGVLAGIASIVIPGFGLVLGGGALAAAITAAGATTVAGAIAGGVTGYLKDQGLPEQVVQNYSNSLSSGSSLLAVNVPSGNVDELVAGELITKYGGADLEIF